jgi:MFS family permease
VTVVESMELDAPASTGAAVSTAAAAPVETDSPQLRHDLTASVGDGAAFGLMVGIGETYVPAFVLAVGLGEVFAGLITTVPLLIGSLLQLISPWAVRRLRSHRRWVVCCAGLQGLCFVPLLIAAVAGEISAAWAMALATVYWGAGQATGPAWNTWQGTIVPRSLRANFYARRSRVQQLATMLGFLAGGFALQWGRTTGDLIPVFAWMFVTAGVCRGLSTACLWAQSEPVPIPAGVQWLGVRESWRRFSTGSTGALLLFVVTMQAGVFVAGPYFNPYILKVLQWDYRQYALLLGSSFVAKFLCLPLWGRFAHRAGAWALLWVGTIGIIPLAGGWNVSSSFWWLLVLQLLAGSAWGAYELAVILLFFETIPERERTSVLTLYNVANALAIVLGSAIGAGLLKAGNVSPESYHWVYSASTALRFVALGLMWRLPRVSVPAAETALFPSAVRPNSASLDEVVLPDLPDQVSGSSSQVSGDRLQVSGIRRQERPGTPYETSSS